MAHTERRATQFKRTVMESCTKYHSHTQKEAALFHLTRENILKTRSQMTQDVQMSNVPSRREK